MILNLGSDDELAALKDAYVQHKGDMEKIINTVMCAEQEDEMRFRTSILNLIESEELPEFKKFTNESAASKKKRQSKV